MKTVVINGSSGFLGSQIIKALQCKYNIITLNRSDYLLSPDKLAAKIEGCDYIINLAGAPISAIWTVKSKMEIYNSRILTTRHLVSSFSFLIKKPLLFLSASGINIYDSIHQHTEDSKFFGNDFLSGVSMDWETEALKASAAGVPVTIIRTGIVLSTHGGFMKQLMKTLPFKVLVKFGNGSNRFLFIHLSDYLNALQLILDNQYSGIFNFVAPEVVNYSIFYKFFKKKWKFWFLLVIPEFLLKLLPGKQSDLFLKSPDVEPANLLLKGYSFIYPTIEESINHLNYNR